ncbi:MAG TPA: hypothetical protein VMV69_20675 [Pirellulales bacterium]|nr:hypothetical protein [Pirellulales bacterium]
MAQDDLASGPSGRKPPPKCKALLICDHCREDPRTARVSVIDILESFRVNDFPTRSPPFTVFSQLVDGIGVYAVSLEIHDLLDGEVVAMADIVELFFSERPARMDFIIPDVSVPLPHFGRYDLVLLANGQEIERQFYDAEDADEEETQGNEVEPQS